MERWNGKVAVVTGASSGIGAAIARELVKRGVITVGLARREDKLKELAEEFKSVGKFYSIKTDLTVDEDINRAFQWVTENLAGIDILINNAGIITKEDYYTSTDVAEKIFRVNVFATQKCTSKALESMKSRNVDGHVININSLAGVKILNEGDAGIWYTASKHTETLTTDILRRKLSISGSRIKVTNIYPAEVDTNIFNAAGLKKPNLAYLEPEDVVDCVLFALSRKPTVLISDLTVTTTGRLM